ncbi:hypothetical protein IJG92_00695 [Candidatus Saccharibacteria bacterium]|nr:hypothetical protein [Candidatus Saccharibacteria bacterium]
MGNEYKRPAKKKDGFLCSDKIIISVKEARKLLGKDCSDKLSDTDLSRMIGVFSKLANSLVDTNAVPKSKVVL